MKLKEEINSRIYKIFNKNNISTLQKKNIELYFKNGFNFLKNYPKEISKWIKNIKFLLNKNIKLEEVKISNNVENFIRKNNLIKKNSISLFIINGNSIFSLKKKYFNIYNYNIKYKKENIKESFYGNICNYKYDVFCSINTILSENIICINIPDNVVLEKPIEILHILTNKYKSYSSLMFNPRILIKIGKNSCVKIIEKYLPFREKKEDIFFINSVIEVYLSDYGIINYYKIQNNKKNIFMIDNTFLKQEKKSICSVYTFSLQGKIKNSLNFFPSGKKSYSYLYGINVLSNDDVIYNSTFVNHKCSNSYSYQLYKNILFDESSSLFNGKIIIEKFINKINAFQKSNSLLFSEKSNVFAKPQLKIYSKNVKCSHGCTISNISKNELFYLQSRGISRKNCEILLLFSFLDDIMIILKDDKMQKYIRKKIKSNFNKFFS